MMTFIGCCYYFYYYLCHLMLLWQDVTGIDEDGLVQGNESEDKFEYLKTISRQSSDPVLLDQKSTMVRIIQIVIQILATATDTSPPTL